MLILVSHGCCLPRCCLLPSVRALLPLFHFSTLVWVRPIALARILHEIRRCLVHFKKVISDHPSVIEQGPLQRRGEERKAKGSEAVRDCSHITVTHFELVHGHLFARQPERVTSTRGVGGGGGRTLLRLSTPKPWARVLVAWHVVRARAVPYCDLLSQMGTTWIAAQRVEWISECKVKCAGSERYCTHPSQPAC